MISDGEVFSEAVADVNGCATRYASPLATISPRAWEKQCTGDGILRARVSLSENARPNGTRLRLYP